VDHHTRLGELQFCPIKKTKKSNLREAGKALLDESSRRKHVKNIKFKPISRKLVIEL